MSIDLHSFVIKNTLDEIQKLCPDLRNVFIFREDGEIVARDKDISEETVVVAMNALDGILEKGDAADGVENMVFEGNKGRLNVSRINELYLVTVTRKDADANHVNIVTQVLVSTVVKLLDKIGPALMRISPENAQIEHEDSAIEQAAVPVEELAEEPAAEPAEEPAEEPEAPEHEQRSESEAKPESRQESIVSKTPVNQFIVENTRGLLAPGDTVRIDNDILLQWSELRQDRIIEEAEIETFGGKKTRCKLKAIKDEKYKGKGIVQMPDKIQNFLGIRKGELVRVKPAVE